MLGLCSGVHFATDTVIPQQRLLQPDFTVRKMIYFRVENLRKLEDSEHDIRVITLDFSDSDTNLA